MAIDIDKVRAEAKELMDRFYEKIKDLDDHPKVGLRRKVTVRTPKPGCDEQFRELFLNNAPKRDRDFVISEKKSW